MALPFMALYLHKTPVIATFKAANMSKTHTVFPVSSSFTIWYDQCLSDVSKDDFSAGGDESHCFPCSIPNSCLIIWQWSQYGAILDHQMQKLTWNKMSHKPTQSRYKKWDTWSIPGSARLISLSSDFSFFALWEALDHTYHTEVYYDTILWEVCKPSNWRWRYYLISKSRFSRLVIGKHACTEIHQRCSFTQV